MRLRRTGTVMAEQEPAGWFDSFPPMPEGWDHHQWCWRHWAPCPVLGANGIAASLHVMTSVYKLMPADASVEGRNQWMADAGKLCCTLGDERMYQIWGQCPPSDGGDQDV